MNRNQKIIVSITGIFIVLLALVGLTYAYFLTQIRGNDNATSISVSTANMILEYGDGNGILSPANKLVPGSPVTFLDANGNTVSSKTFTVENKGNADITNYAVTLENFSLTYTQTGKTSKGVDVVAGQETTLAFPETMRITITCTSNKGSCNGLDNGMLPNENAILLYNDIKIGEKHSYTLTMEYIDNGDDQSEDMNKTLSAKINIIDSNNTIDLTGEVEKDIVSTGDYVQINSEPKTSRLLYNSEKDVYTYKIIGVKPDEHTIGIYSKTDTTTPKGSSKLSIVKGTEASVSGNVITFTDTSRLVTVDVTKNYLVNLGEIKELEKTINNPYIENTLAYIIFENAKNVTEQEKSKLYAELSKPKTEVGKQISAPDESVLAPSEDDDAISYYFRGNVKNNYVNYNEMCWRIVRIQGDQTIKLILADENGKYNDSTYSPDNENSALINESQGINYNLYSYDTPYELIEWASDKIKDSKQITATNWCSDESLSEIEYIPYEDSTINVHIYGATNRIYSNLSPTLKCDMTGINNTSAQKLS